MKKILFVLMMTTLAGCVSHETTPSKNFEGYNVKQEIEIVPPENIVLQPDEQIQALQQISVPDSVINGFDDGGAYLDVLTKKLRKELRGTEIQVREASHQIDLVIPNKVAFGSNQIDLQNKFEGSMNSVATLLKEYDQTMLQIVGYTDEMESVLKNKEVSFKKAEVIATFLKNNGINPERIKTDGMGADNPVASSSTPSGREKNRRVEITIISLK